MKIAVDCRYLLKSGIGRLLEGTLDSFDYKADEFYLWGREELLEKYRKMGAHIVRDESDPFTFNGLCAFPKRLNKICDALIIPNFIIPFSVKIPVHAVMHDLIFLDRPKETTKGFSDRLIKRTLLKRCLKKAKSVACVSKFTYSRCEHYYGKNKKLLSKCYVNYTGLSRGILQYAEKHPKKEAGNYFVYVGNVKKHKGLPLLLEAFSKMKGKEALKIIGEKEGFLTGLKIEEEKYPHVLFTGKLSDEEVYREVQGAKYLILPSEYEGFGLPPLEALALGTQPIITNIPPFREIYAGFPVKFFKTKEELIKAMGEEPQQIDVLERAAEKYNLKNFSEAILNRARGGGDGSRHA